MKDVYMIGNAHIDPVWLWKKIEGFAEIKSTFRSALDRMNEFPGYIFTAACASYYEWIEEVDPQMFEEICQRVKEGRWVIVGGFWVQPDCNIPSGEAFARHLLYSQRYFREKLGTTAKIGYNVDSFGHNGMLPQLLKNGGIEGYVFQRPDANAEKPELPEYLFWWESPDGTRMLTHRLREGYGDFYSENGLEPSVWKAQRLLEISQEESLPYMCFYGVGNHGGGPTIRGLQALEEILAKEPSIIYSSPNEFFEYVSASSLPESLRVVKDDLQHHASGCYAAHSGVKAANRRAENELAAAEKYDMLANRLTGFSTHTDDLRQAWKKVLFNQFHDILAGCCIKDAYIDALNAFSSVRDTAMELSNLALQRISWRIRTTRVLDGTPCQKNGWILWEKNGEGAPVVVFNPHSFPLETPVQLNITVKSICDSQGNPVPIQKIRGPQTNGDDMCNTLFWAKIPAFGYAVYYLYREQEFPIPACSVAAGEDYLENEYLRVRFDKTTGSIIEFFDKENNREMAAAPMAVPLVMDDTAADTWAHGIYTFDNEVGRFTNARLMVLENGPFRAAIRVISQYGASTLIQDFSLLSGEKQLNALCRLNFQEAHRSVKLSFPVNVQNNDVVYSMPYGFLSKAASGTEEPAHEWMLLADDAAGMALLNDSKYSFSAQDNDMRMMIARSAIYADHYGQEHRDELVEYLDQGEQTFQYALRPCRKDDIASAVQAAAVLNLPPVVIPETHHDGSLPPVYEGVQISCDNVLLQTLKKAEDGNGTILRLYETAGRETTAKILLPDFAAEIEAHFRPQEIKSFRVSADGSLSEIDFIEDAKENK